MSKHSKFYCGETVKITREEHRFYGCELKIIDVGRPRGWEHEFKYKVCLPNGEEPWFQEFDLERVDDE